MARANNLRKACNWTMTPQPPSPGWIDWSTGYCIELWSARKKVSVYLLLPVGAFTPTPSATLPVACVWGFNNHALPTRLMSPSPKAWAAWRTVSGRTADCVPSKTGTVKLRLNRSVAAYVSVTSDEWMWLLIGWTKGETVLLI